MTDLVQWKCFYKMSVAKLQLVVFMCPWKIRNDLTYLGHRLFCPLNVKNYQQHCGKKIGRKITSKFPENVLTVAHHRLPEICSGYLVLVVGRPTWLPRKL